MLFRDNGIVHPVMYLTTIIAIALMAITDDRAIQVAGAVLLIATIISPMVRSWREEPPARGPAAQLPTSPESRQLPEKRKP